MHISLSSTLIALFALTPSILAAKAPKNAILLSNVKTLTLRDNAKTSHRRVPAIPQLTCKGPGCRHYKVDVMRCTNQGSDYEKEDIQWSCTANLPAEFKLGGTEVTCEGYSSSSDEYVLKGSCGVEYRLLLTEQGEEKYGSSMWGDGGGEGSTVGKLLFGALFFGVAAWILYSIYQAYMNPGAIPRPRQRPNGGFFGGGWGPGGGGGGGPGGWDDPPPPYPGKPHGTRQQGFQPGFWSGALGGAAAGYMAGSRSGRQQQQYPQQPGGSWFGGGGNNGGGGSSWRSGGSSGSSSGSSRHESTGFGSTSRR